MKKFIAFLTFFAICVLSLQSAFAYDGKIEFRDIPWGTNYDKAVAKIGIKFHERSGDFFYVEPVNDLIFGHGESSYEFQNNDLNIWAQNALFSLAMSDIKIGGFSPAAISMYFAYVPVNGILTRETKDSKLYAASYTLDESSDVDVLSNIYGKLVSIYGEESKKGTHNNDGYVYYIWTGTEDTALVLKAMQGYNDSVEIIYAWYGGDKLLLEADETLSKNIADKAQAEKDFIENDKSGL